MTKHTDNDRKISKGRTHIILRDPFFASILMDMNPVIDGSVTDTCATNGEQVIFNPDWLAEADHKIVAAAMRKMSMHVALSHHLRRGPHRQPARWRTACDQAVLHIMQADGVELPDGMTPSFIYAGMTADQIYKLIEDGENDDKDDGDGDGDSGAQGGADGQGGDQGQGQGDSPAPAVGQPHDGADMRDQQEVASKQSDNDQRVMRAQMAAKAQGKESGTGKDIIDMIKAKSVDWRDRLQEFISSSAEVRMSWSKPNRRFIHQDIILPGKTPDGIGTLVVIVDTSGSMGGDELAMCAAQIELAREAIGITQVVVIQIDTKVKQVDTLDQFQPMPTSMEFKGRGGTNMQPAFDEALKHDPDAIVMMTDGVFTDLTEDQIGRAHV